MEALGKLLGLRISERADKAWTTVACVVRRIAASHAPCGRRELIFKASRALAGALPEEPSSMLHEVLDDLIAAGDLTEQVGLRQGEEDAPVLIFLAPPGFSRAPKRVYLHGAAPDDAPCIPGSVSEDMVSSGTQRFLDCDDADTTAELLAKFGLVEHAIEGRLTTSRPGLGESVALYRACLERGQTLEPSEFMRWMGPACGLPYRKRWGSDPESSGLQIARVPQFYGADAWLLVDHDTSRAVQLPVHGIPDERGCDAAWRLQLALDAIAGMPAKFSVRLEGEFAHVRLDFPLPQQERRRLLNLGGMRPSALRPYDLCVPSDMLAAAHAVFEQLGFEPATKGPTQ